MFSHNHWEKTQVDYTVQLHRVKRKTWPLTSSCRIAVSLSLISSRSCSVMATSSSWLCIWFHSSWLQGDKHSSWFLLSKVCRRHLQHPYCQKSLRKDQSSGINQPKSLRAAFFISRGKGLITPRKQSPSFHGQHWDEAELWGMGLLAVSIWGYTVQSC